MPEVTVVDSFLALALAIAIGFVIGLEREVSKRENPHATIRDFVLFALWGAVSAYLARQFDLPWILVVSLVGLIALLLAAYWAARRNESGGLGVTTELAAIMTFLLGAAVVGGTRDVAIAAAILVLAVLSQVKPIRNFRDNVRRFELDATLKLLVITFIVLPVLPKYTVDGLIALPIGTVERVESGETVDAADASVVIALIPGQTFAVEQTLSLFDEESRPLGELRVTEADATRLVGLAAGDRLTRLEPGTEVRADPGVRVLSVMLSAIKPYSVWLIVVLVSMIGFVGYVLVKIVGARAGIGLTGLVGGLASSTVTTVSFARRSREAPQWNTQFAVAVILASTMMFPRLLVQVSFVNVGLMRRAAVPVLVMGGVGILVAALYWLRSKRETGTAEALELKNPFSLKSALTFALVFASVLMVTRLAITYLGDAWLPLVALVSGLTDADAIAFSVSNAERAGLITLDWAAFNLVLGAIANTVMKLLIAFSIGDRGLFKRVFWAILIISISGLVTMFLYYDLGAIRGVAATP